MNNIYVKKIFLYFSITFLTLIMFGTSSSFAVETNQNQVTGNPAIDLGIIKICRTNQDCPVVEEREVSGDHIYGTYNSEGFLTLTWWGADETQGLLNVESYNIQISSDNSSWQLLKNMKTAGVVAELGMYDYKNISLDICKNNYLRVIPVLPSGKLGKAYNSILVSFNTLARYPSTSKESLIDKKIQLCRTQIPDRSKSVIWNFSASVSKDKTLNLSWFAPEKFGDGSPISYIVEYSTDRKNWTILGKVNTLSVGVKSNDFTKYTHYRITPITKNGLKGSPSDVMDVDKTLLRSTK